ncbi:MAG: acyltransferase [Clostridia bacterium]|nr:acyltransferase [Clostridia bacterium]
MRNAVVAFLSVCRLALLSLVRRGVKFNPVQDISPSSKVSVEKGGKLTLGARTHLRPRALIHVLSGGNMRLGAHCYMGQGSIITCKGEVTVGDGVSFGPNVTVYDHDHVFGVDGGFRREEYTTAPVVIGKDVWIGAGTIILRGTNIGDNCVVGAGCLLKGDYPPGSLIIQKRTTSVKPIKPVQ